GEARGVRPAVIPNAEEVEYSQPRPTDPPPDGRTVVFFGLLSYVPNIDGVAHFVQDIWPRIARTHPKARCKIIGGHPPSSLLELAGPRIELTGFVADLRPHLAAAAAGGGALPLGGRPPPKNLGGYAPGDGTLPPTPGDQRGRGGAGPTPAATYYTRASPTRSRGGGPAPWPTRAGGGESAGRRGNWRWSGPPGVERRDLWRVSTAASWRSAREGNVHQRHT